MPAPIGPGRSLQTPRLTRARFRSRLLAILGDCRLLWMPRAGDAATNLTDETSAGRVVTYDATVAARLSALGRGVAQTFDGSTNYGTTPDTADLSFGNGATDQPFSIVALANVTDTAAARRILSKSTTGNLEWVFTVSPGDLLALSVSDASVPVTAQRVSTGTISQGAWHLYGASYDGTGGATAMNGAALYQDGAAIASTATNQATYVAMENTTTPVEIGSDTGHTASFFPGSLALVAISARNLSAADHAAIAALCRRYFGQGLP